MRKPAMVVGEPMSLEEMARFLKIPPGRARELEKIARELVAKRPGGNGHSRTAEKAAAKRAPRKTYKR